VAGGAERQGSAEAAEARPRPRETQSDQSRSRRTRETGSASGPGNAVIVPESPTIFKSLAFLMAIIPFAEAGSIQTSMTNVNHFNRGYELNNDVQGKQQDQFFFFFLFVFQIRNNIGGMSS
jgi:hypothetical protein